MSSTFKFMFLHNPLRILIPQTTSVLSEPFQTCKRFIWKSNVAGPKIHYHLYMIFPAINLHLVRRFPICSDDFRIVYRGFSIIVLFFPYCPMFFYIFLFTVYIFFFNMFQWFSDIFPCFLICSYDFLMFFYDFFKCMFTMLFQYVSYYFPIYFPMSIFPYDVPICFPYLPVFSLNFPKRSHPNRASGGRFARRCTSSARSSNSSASPGAFLAVKQWENPLTKPVGKTLMVG